MTRDQTIGIDIGGTKILAAIVDPATGIAGPVDRLDTPESAAGLTAAVVDVATRLSRTASVRSIGLGIPGLVGHDGRLRYGPNVPGILDLDLVGVLHEVTGLPVAATNDGTCAALAELRFGVAVGASEVLLITQGTGLAGGLVANGRLVTGAHGFTGEPGHMLIQQAGPRCVCGRYGCWEAVASGTGLANLARQVAERFPDASFLGPVGGDRARLRGEHVMAAFEAGDHAAEIVVAEFVYWVSRGIGSLISLLDPELVILGGGLATSNANFLDAVNASVASFVIGGDYRPEVPIVGAHFGEHAGMIGAALFGSEAVGERATADR